MYTVLGLILGGTAVYVFYCFGVLDDIYKNSLNYDEFKMRVNKKFPNLKDSHILFVYNSLGKKS